MGFLNVNNKRRSPFPRTSLKAKVLKPTSTTKPAEPSGLAPLERLSSDVLKLVMVYSANIQLPQTSMAIAAKLPRSRHLELALIREQMDGHSLYVSPAVKWPFVTKEMFETLEVGEFRNPNLKPVFVPTSLESQLHDVETVKKIAYMVERDCRVENSQKVYMALILNELWSAVSAMIRTKHRASAEIVEKALVLSKNASLAMSLLKLTPVFEEGSDKFGLLPQSVPAIEYLLHQYSHH